MIYTDEKILRTPCVDVLESEVSDLISKLEVELDLSGKNGLPGIGLACPQIGIFKKAAIIRLNEHSINLINCNISKKYDEFTFNEEGCLSFPNKFEKTKRFREIVVENNMVYPHKFVATGLLAVAIQHEIDHLNNILLPDLSLKEDKILINVKIKLRPNDLCNCGSGKKYKKCHGK
jgi:peptide deformylase